MIQINKLLNKNEKLLFDGATNTTATLSETAANFKYLEIYYRSAFEVRNSVKIDAPNGKIFSMQCVWWRSEENKILSYVAFASISGTSITISHSGEFNIFSSSAVGNANTNLYITKVIGYK